MSAVLGVCVLSCAGAQQPAAAPTVSASNPTAAPIAAPAPTATSVGVWGPPAAACSKQVAQSSPTAHCEGGAVLESLATALRLKGKASDAELRSLETCSEFPAGVIRALRSERMAPECRDLLIADYVVPEATRADVRDVLIGLGLSAQLRRLVQDPPKLAPPHDKQRVEAFVKGELARWIQVQAKAVFELSSRGAALSGYAQGVVAIEAGMADMRFVEAARSAPVPAEIQGDAELTEAYYASLDQALEPRKTRGRDAALVGLKQFAAVGIVRDERVLRARTMLSQLYAGRRIDALDSLLLPPAEQQQQQPGGAESSDETVAAQVPSFYVPLLAPKLDVVSVPVLVALRHRGLPRFARLELDKPSAPAAARAHYAYHLFELARTYWHAEDFAQAAKVAAPLKGARIELIAALSEILRAGPRDAAVMMIQGPELPKAIGAITPLDRLAKQSPSLSGFAAFDSALLLETAPPLDAKAAYFYDVAKRYARAAQGLPPTLRKLAQERQKAAEDTARAVK